ncbi:uncharacterized protein Z519_10081 [Cladophialophora bantiana CBS 173.52]|uniref:Uncharacterized protein n=1 Tax=Cladophialophora bantiana (strain ATCC 10958 / CBS 173.52 / CDC B-1940 / NIH 8579) TaxID=1442370 RepID=A0A0D2H7D8_CLAB1|nr:uncharacterized protein Z519_10081 [Cladophialophora bantiana CBS 173.52]KIW89228.1 hypothetical protein Z519_10081 [Cladophialophora bantiana CBS 173.52]
MAEITFTAPVPLPANMAFVGGATVSASISLPLTTTLVTWTALSAYGPSTRPGTATFAAILSIAAPLESRVITGNGDFTVYPNPGGPTTASAKFTGNSPDSSFPGPTTSISLQSSASPAPSSGSLLLSTSPASVATSLGSPSSSTSPVSVAQPTQTKTPIVIKGYSTADLVGAAVGCGIGGALLVGVAAFLMYRRRNRRNLVTARGSEKERSDPVGSNEDVVVVETRAWGKHLPQSESDQAVRSMASRTLDQIEMHVENFYQDATNVSISRAAESEMRNLDSSHLPDSLLNLIRTSRRPTCLIKHCVANLILSRIDFENGSGDSFLPGSMIALESSSTAPEKPGERNHVFGRVGAADQKLTGFAQAFAHWRVMSAYLRREPERDEAYREERDRRITTAATKLCIAFEPWARSADNARFQSIVGIMQRASDLGIMLFSQPASFQWQWETGNRGGATQNGPGQVAVLPGLYKMTDEEVHRLASPIHLIEPRLGWHDKF